MLFSDWLLVPHFLKAPSRFLVPDISIIVPLLQETHSWILTHYMQRGYPIISPFSFSLHFLGISSLYIISWSRRPTLSCRTLTLHKPIWCVTNYKSHFWTLCFIGAPYILWEIILLFNTCKLLGLSRRSKKMNMRWQHNSLMRRHCQIPIWIPILKWKLSLSLAYPRCCQMSHDHSLEQPSESLWCRLCLFIPGCYRTCRIYIVM